MGLAGCNLLKPGDEFVETLEKVQRIGSSMFDMVGIRSTIRKDDCRSC